MRINIDVIPTKNMQMHLLMFVFEQKMSWCYGINQESNRLVFKINDHKRYIIHMYKHFPNEGTILKINWAYSHDIGVENICFWLFLIIVLNMIMINF